MIKGWYINLEQETQRRLEMEKQLDYLGLSADYQRMTAIDGRTHSLSGKTKLSAGELGCWLSHLQVLQQADTNHHLHIMEDDAILHPKINNVFQHFLQQHTCPQWDILYTDIVVPPEVGNFKYLYGLLTQYRHDEKIQFLDISRVSYAAATSYLVNQESIPKLLNLLDQGWTSKTPYDIKLRNLAHQGQLKTWVCFPFFSTLSNASDESSIKTEDVPWRPFDLYRRSFYVDASLKELLHRFKPSPVQDDMQVQIYFRLLETLIDPTFQSF